ncbi:tetratricopeptide repeat protein [Archangium violaceum]|uniref:serine/threonine-protein kinase n=1 Tax=Archangium violaceum TaxID=83451 RepID=UPI001950033F|nr:serine/threonine-protein kinase [Archangium violaceum]QRN94706.1 tetratricopeptide repeat protein [Archangium violaceum]
MPCLDEATFMGLMLGELPPERASEVDRHLDTCPDCRRLVADAVRARTPPVPSPPSDLPSSPAASPVEAVLPRGTAVGRYLVLERLGAGGMGVVYSAYDPELDRRVALKLLRVVALGLDAEEGRAHLLREAQAMARVSHPHVVSVYDVGTFGEQVFLAMEYVEAQTLRQWMRAAPRSWREVRDVFLDAGRGLSAAHAAGLVHGDFKPENLLVGRDGRVRVTDFGLARRTTPGHTPEVVGGTPAYMAPEQFGREGRADARSDQFAFCVALYEALHGERPFAGDTERELAAEVRAGRVRPAPKGTGVPPWLHQLVARGLEVDPTARHPSLEALLSELTRDPARRRRWWLQVGGGVALLLLSVGLTHALHTHAARACQNAGEKVAGIWGPQQKQEAEAAFLATGRPFAQEAWKSARRTLDAYTAAWATLHTAACEATRVRGEQSPEVLGRRMRCLDERLAEVAALARLFTQADASVVQHAHRTAEQLSSLATCSNLAALEAAGPVPRDDAARQRAEALRTALVEGRTLGASGRYKEGAARVLPAAEAARAAGDRYGSAEALLLVAELRDQAADYRGAEKAVQDAVWAAEAGRNDAVAARAWTLAVRITGERLEKYTLANLWRERAEAALARVGDDEVLRARLLTNEGRVLATQGRFAEASERHREALALLEKTRGPEDLEVADVLLELGSAHVAMGHQEEALTHLRRARSLRERILGPNHPEVAMAILALGDAAWQLRDIPEAARLALQAREMFERALGPEHPSFGYALNFYAMTQLFDPKADRREILSLMERARSIIRAVDGLESTSVPYLNINLAQVLMAQGRLQEAEQYFRESIAQEEARQGPDYPPLSLMLSGLAEVLLHQDRSPEALPYFERALAIHQAQPGDYRNFRGELLMNMGWAYLRAKRPREAIPPLERAVSALEGAPEGYQRHREIALFRLARALWDSGEDRVRARRLITEALDMVATDTLPGAEKVRANLEQWLAEHPPVVPPNR